MPAGLLLAFGGAAVALVATAPPAAAFSGGADASGWYTSANGLTGACIDGGAAVPTGVDYTVGPNWYGGTVGAWAWMASNADAGPAGAHIPFTNGVTMGGPMAGQVAEPNGTYTAVEVAGAGLDNVAAMLTTGGTDLWRVQGEGQLDTPIKSFVTDYPGPWRIRTTIQAGPYYTGDTYSGTAYVYANLAGDPTVPVSNVALTSSNSGVTVALSNTGHTVNGVVPFHFTITNTASPSGSATIHITSVNLARGYAGLQSPPSSSYQRLLAVPSRSSNTATINLTTYPPHARIPATLIKYASGSTTKTPIAGATFLLTNETTGFQWSETTASTPVSFDVSTNTTYNVKETAAPPGYYIASPGNWDLTVPGAISSYSFAMADPILLHTRIPATLIKYASGSTTKTPIAGATFLLTNETTGFQWSETTASTPVSFDVTTNTTYNVKETAAPPGYYIASPGNWDFTVPNLATSYGFSIADPVIPSPALSTAMTPAYPDTSGNHNTAIPEGPAGSVSPTPNGPLSGGAVALSNSGWLSTTNELPGPETFTQLAWFKTTGSGSILGFMSSQGAAASSFDRMIWVDPTGHVVAGVWPGGEISSPGTYANGAWHLAAVTLSSSGFDLYVDGSLVASNTSITSAQAYDGFWHIGLSGATFGAWADSPTNAAFPGSLAGVGVLPTALSPTAVSALYHSTDLASYSSAVEADTPTAYWPLQPDTSGSVVPLGTPVSDSVTISGNDGESGTLAWKLDGPTSGPSNFAGAPVAASGSVAISGSQSSLNTPGFSPTAPGWYSFTEQLTLSPSGVVATSAAGQSAETFQVSASSVPIDPPKLALWASPSPSAPAPPFCGSYVCGTSVSFGGPAVVNMTTSGIVNRPTVLAVGPAAGWTTSDIVDGYTSTEAVCTATTSPVCGTASVDVVPQSVTFEFRGDTSTTGYGTGASISDTGAFTCPVSVAISALPDGGPSPAYADQSSGPLWFQDAQSGPVYGGPDCFQGGALSGTPTSQTPTQPVLGVPGIGGGSYPYPAVALSSPTAAECDLYPVGSAPGWCATSSASTPSDAIFRAFENDSATITYGGALAYLGTVSETLTPVPAVNNVTTPIYDFGNPTTCSADVCG